MKQSRFAVTIALPLISLLPFAALADEFDTTTPTTDHSDQNGWTGGAEFNANISKGNTNIETLGAAGQVTFKAMPYTTTAKASYMRNRTDEVERARHIDASLRTGFNVANNLDFFALGAFMQDRFRGIEHQWLVTPGLGGYLVNNDAFSARLEVGAGFLNEEYYPFMNSELNTSVWTGGLGLMIKISENADITDDALFVDRFNETGDYRIMNVGAINAHMTKLLSLKVSQTTAYRHYAVALHKATDNYTTAAIVLKF